MRRLLFLTIAWLWLSPWLFASHTFQIPHLAGNGWKTLVTAYNEGDQPATVLFTQWNDLGARIREIVSTVPAHGQHLWTEGDILPEGIATVTTDAGKVCVKLTYQYGNSRSICEFSITPDFLGTQWLIPNAHRKTPGWFGMAAANHGERSVEVSVSALRDGLEIRRASLSLMPGRKLAALSGDLWGLDCSQVDAVLVRSEEPIAAPILISGNVDQSRHVYFTGRRLETAAGERRFYVPHVAGNSWTTEIVVYNSGPEPGTFSLHQYDDSGNEIKTFAQKVLPFGSATLSTGDNQLAGSGSALLTGRGSLSVKLSYRYGDSDSVCEFLVNGDVGREWLLPNSAPWWLEWSGVALQNPGPTPVDAIIRAYKAGVEVRKAAITIGPRQKWAALLNQSLNLNPLDFDHLSVETNQPVPMPLAITGDNAQDHHVFFGGQALTVSSILKKWTYLFYSDAEFANGYNPTPDFALEAYSGPNLEVLVLEDTMTTPTTLYRVVTPGSLRTLEPPQEKNMGDSGTLYDFIMKAKTEYPAERYILAFYDHGSGWQGCCMDQTSNDRGLTMKEIESAVSAAGGVDLVLFTAPCLMGELESVYQLRDWADVYVGSEDLSGYIGWFGTIGFIRGTLETSPEIGSAELGREIVGAITRTIPANELRFRSTYGSMYTMSAVDVKAVPALAADLDALAAAFLQGQVDNNRISAITPWVQNYNQYFSVDLYDFLNRYEATEGNPEILALISKVQESLNRCILAEYHGSGNPGSHGLTIYLPLSSYVSYQSIYGDPDYGLDFAADTRWDEFLKFNKSAWW